MTDIITCPSGLTGRIRGMKVREEQVLADRKLAKGGGQVDELLAACWEETLDLGPYTFPDGGKLDWGKVLQGDRFFALLMVRALTYGPEYAFGVGRRNDACRARIDWELDLTKLPVRLLSDTSRAAFVGCNRFETTLPDAGKRVGLRLLTAAAGGGVLDSGIATSIGGARATKGRGDQVPQWAVWVFPSALSKSSNARCRSTP